MTRSAKKQDLQNSTKWITLLAVGISIFMGTLDMSIINVSLPTLVRELQTSFATIQWVILGYVLVVTSMMLTAARLGDILVKKNLFALGLALFTLGSLLCGFSPGVGWLIAFRILQGSGAVITQALGAALIVEVFPSSQRGRALGLIGTIVSVGLAVGPAIGGIIIGLIGWPWIFWINVPLGILAILVIIRYVPANSPGTAGERFDFLGALILLITLCSYALGLTLGQNQGFMYLPVLILLALAAFGIFGFLILEKKISQPMIDLTLFKNKLLSINLGMSFLTFVVLGGGMLILPFYLQYIMGLPPQQVGLMLMVIPVSMGIISPFSGHLSDIYGPRAISLIGLLIITAACLAISTLHTEVSIYGFIWRASLLGFGGGIFQSPNNSAIMGAVPMHRLGITSGLLAISRNLGHSTGIPLIGSVFTAIALAASGYARMDISGMPGPALVQGLCITYRLAAALILIAALLSAAAILIEKRSATEPA